MDSSLCYGVGLVHCRITIRKESMDEEKLEQAFIAWVNKEERIVTFRDTEGFEKLTFQSQEDKLSYIYNLCETGYKIM